MSREFRPGSVISYPYLWAWQQQHGETEGRKPRPVCVVVAVRNADDGKTHLALLAITRQPPQAGRIAIEVPEMEQRRAGLDDCQQCWIIADEYNYDVVERSWYLEPQREILGRFSKSFMMKVAAEFAGAVPRSAQVDRFD